MDYTIPTVLMIVMTLTNTAAIQFLNKKRKTLDVATADGAAKSRQLRLIIILLYAEIPLLTAIIWFVLAPLLSPAVTA